MGTIQVPGRLSGRTYTLTIKGDTPSETEQARIRDFVGSRESAFSQRYESTMGKPLAEPDDGTAVGRGLDRGKAGAKSVLGTTVETVGEQLGIAGLADYGRSMEEAAAKRQLDLSLLQPPATTRQDVAAAEGFFPTIGKSLTYAGELAGEQIPQLGVGLAGGAAGAVAGGLAAGPPGALAGFGVGSGLVEAPMLFGANVQRQEEEVAAGRKKAVDLTDALTATVGQAALTSAANALAGAGVFLRPGAKLFTRAVSGAGVGATTESLNEVGQAVIERYQAGLPVDSPDAIKEYIDAGIAGGVLGGGAGGIGGAVGGSRPVEPTRAEEEKRLADIVPSTKGPVKPGEAKISNTMVVEKGGAAGTIVGLTDNSTIRLPGKSSKADIEKAVAQYNETKAREEAAVVPPTVEEAVVVPPTVEEAVVAPTVEEAVVAPTVEEAVVAPTVEARPVQSYLDEDFMETAYDLTAPERAAAEAKKAAVVVPPTVAPVAVEVGPAQKNLFAEPTSVEAPVEAPAKAAEPAVLTNDLVTQLGVREAKSASLRKLVGTPLTDKKVMRALDSWAQNDRATEENKQLARSLITGQPITPAEPANVAETAKAKPEAVGDGAVDRAQGMGSVGGTGSDTEAATRVKTPAEVGLEPDMSVPSGTAVSTGEQPAALIEEEQLDLFEALPTTPAPRVPVRSVEQIMRDAEPSTEQQLPLDFTPPYDAGTGAARQYIPGTITRVNRALQPTGETRIEESDIYAPTAAPTMKPNAMVEVDKLLANRYQTTATLGVKRGAKLLNEVGIKKGVRDPLSVKDKQAVLTLLFSRAEALSPQAAAAKLYFSKVERPIDAILMMVDDLTVEYGKYRAAPGTPSWQSEFSAGTGATAAKQALEFVNKMSPEVRADVEFRISLSAQQNAAQATWIADNDRVELAREQRKQTQAQQTADAEESDYIREAMSTDPLAALDRELHYSVKMSLDAGDLKGALSALSATTNNANLSKLAARFAELTGTTRVKVLYPGDSAKNIGRSRGSYWAAPAGSDPEQTNIIYLNGQIGMDAHVLMHEMAHAVTADIRYLQPNHPVLKQLEALRKDIMKQSGHRADRDAFYGLTDLAEFIAEGFGRVGLGESDSGLLDLMKRTNIYTEVGYQRELPLNAAQRFKEIVGNFLRSLVGLPSKPYPRKTEYDTKTVKENAMDQFQRLVDGILSTAPQVLPDSVFQKAVSSPMVARNVLNNAIQNAPVWNGAGRQKLADMMQASIPMPLRRMLLGLLHLDWFDDLAGKYFPEIRELKVIDDLRRGELVRLVDMSKPVHADLQEYATKQPEMMSRLAAIQGRATLEQVDPTRPVSTYGADQDKVRVWHELNRDLNQGGPEMRALFKTVRNMMASYRTEIKAVLADRVKALSDDVAMQNQLVSRLMAKLDEGNVIDPYFSLMRKGDFWLSYTSEDTTGEALLVDPAAGTMKRPTAQFVQAFESVWEREQFKTKLAATKDADGNDIAWDVEEFMRPVTYVKGQTVPSAFVQGAINIVTGMVKPGATTAEQDQANEAISAIQDMFVRFTPEHSLMKSFTQRKGTRGFIGDITPLNVVDSPLDIVNALAEKSSSLAYQLANMKYGAKIQALRNRAKATEKTLNKSSSLTAAEKVAVQAYLEEFDARADFAQSPNVSKAAQVARGVTFGMTLGFNVAGAANNLMQIPMIGMPELAGRYSLTGAVREIGSASRLLMNAGKTYKVTSYGPDGSVQRELSGVDNFGSIANYFEVDAAGNYVLRTDKKIPAKLRQKLANMDVLVEALSVNGMLSNSMAQEMLETESGWGQKINKWSGFLMHHGERFNRQTMAIAAYNLELGNIKGPISKEAKVAAAKKAIEITERVNGSIGATTAPRFAQGSVGSIVFMFKRFGLQMARYILNTANQALRGKDPVGRKVARYQITGILGTTALFAGVQGLPFFGELMSLINLIFTDDDEESAEVILQKYLQEPFYNGALNYLTGAEIASRISLSGLIFRENKIEKDQSLLYDMVETLGGPAVGVFMNAERGVGLLSQGETYRGIEAMMPSVIKSAMKSVRYGTEGATTLRRDEIVPMSNMDLAMQFLGYTPGVYARTQERVSGQKRIDEAVRVEKRKLYRKYYLAYLEGDFEELRSIVKDMQEFSRKNPEEQITGEKLSQSLNSNIQRSKEMIGGVAFSPNFRPRAVQELSEFDEDTSLWAS